ncbi:hypothetical protein [Butyrivibrio sp.]|uniref:IS66 family insertion sequence element accessory protein TnpA n=1 Tax=Butyrivibrio sp. TaxID=28121 RepID=UPI0025C5797E|nr:hypothetical protein [Butyrivibrio sp.]MBQ9304923.1 hypothetical protein [Butyrivibrio sp.]
MSNPRKVSPSRSDEEWYNLIMNCRKSGMSDAQFCRANGIATSTLSCAIKRLRAKSYGIPEHRDDDIHDLTTSKQDVVKVDIIPDIQPPRELIPEVAPHIDNSHMIEISLGDVHISLCNGADPDLVTRTLSALRSFV